MEKIKEKLVILVNKVMFATKKESSWLKTKVGVKPIYGCYAESRGYLNI